MQSTYHQRRSLNCSTAKGLYLKTKQLVGHAILDALNRAEQPLAFLSGPGFAEEIVQGFPTSVVIASDQLLATCPLFGREDNSTGALGASVLFVQERVIVLGELPNERIRAVNHFEIYESRLRLF
jgi:hypothetical protein